MIILLMKIAIETVAIFGNFSNPMKNQHDKSNSFTIKSMLFHLDAALYGRFFCLTKSESKENQKKIKRKSKICKNV